MREVSKFIAAFLVFVILGAGMYLGEVKRIEDQPKVYAVPEWVSAKELKHLMHYHGTIALRITMDDVAIWRVEKQKWIVVLINDAE